MHPSAAYRWISIPSVIKRQHLLRNARVFHLVPCPQQLVAVLRGAANHDRCRKNDQTDETRDTGFHSTTKATSFPFAKALRHFRKYSTICSCMSWHLTLQRRAPES